MTVFKAYMKIAKKNKWLFMMYLAVFFAITVIFQKVSAGEEKVPGYQKESVPIGIVDADKGALADSLKEYLGRTNEIVLLPDEKEVLQENLFYRNVQYIVWIPESFAQTCIAEDGSLKVVKLPGSSSGYYIDQQINSFLQYAKIYETAGFTETEAAEKMRDIKSAEITLLAADDNEGKTPGYAFYYQYMPYTVMSVVCYMLGYILLGFRREELSRRMQASAVSRQRQSAEGIAAACILSFALWVILTVVGMLIYGERFIRNERFVWFLVNSLVLVLTVLSIAYLCGLAVKNPNALSGLVNTLTLGMCFVCGVFVPLEYLNKTVKTAAQFLPIYWYEKVNQILREFGDITGSVRTEVLQGIGIQLVFALAFICVTFAVSREKRW